MAALSLLLWTQGRVRAESMESAPTPKLSWLWLGTQWLPSPEVALGSEGSMVGLRWQITPLLYTFGLDPRVARWRSFIVEPLARHAGSIELYAAPELFLGSDGAFLLRPGMRVYLPLVEHGEALSASLGISYQRIRESDAAALELGLYFLFGILGVQVSHTPAQRNPAQTILTFSLRYF